MSMFSEQTQAILPQEIFDDVIDHFHDDHDLLRICALVSTSWLASARIHLFHSVSLDPPKHSNTNSFNFFVKPHLSSCRKLYDCISLSKRSRFGSLAPYIRELRICEGMLKREWLAYEPTLHLLLRTLDNLQRFEISRSASVPIQWGHLPSPLKGAIEEHLLGLPSLTEVRLSSLKLENRRDLTKILRACGNLRVLEVDHFEFVDEREEVLNGQILDGGYPAAPLDVLIVGPRTSAAFIKALLHPSCGVAVGTIRRLAMSISGDFADFAKLLHAASSVESLELTLMNDIFLEEYFKLPPSSQFDLSQVPGLRNLKVNIDVLQKLEDPLPWLSIVLRSGTDTLRGWRKNQVENIFISYSLYLPAPYMDRSANTTIFDRWSEIDMILCGLDGDEEHDKFERSSDLEEKHSHAYDNLQSVRLEFVLENPIGFGVAPRFLKEIVLDSPRLESKNMLTIRAYDTSR